MTKIWLETMVLSPEAVRVDVKMADAPADLFGVSFHLVGSGAGWNMESYNLGDVFDGNMPLFLVSSKENEIVAGIVLKRGDVADIRDGTLMSFLVYPQQEGRLEFAFSNQVLSVFRNGRVDLNNVEWTGGAVDVFAAANALKETRSDTVVSGAADFGYTAEVPRSITLSAADAVDVRASTFSEHGRITDIYEFLGLAMLVLVVCGAIYLLYFCRKRE
ncbi:hypothetical protein KJ951_00715 [Patescibacteria group bacterium]|nr:hypothetical protein [Patescibacteria group bacterium]MBU1702903.1 hypothetical protein [Patescibacteria group bacterium]MBU1953595.1 hypothetical protein [Patescibacteria group bacterium]